MEVLHPAQCPLTGIGFRVIACRAGVWLSDPSLVARYPTARLDNNSAVIHLRGVRIRGPWKSIFCTWEAAMTRRESFLRNGATDVCILAVDLEHYLVPGRQYLRGIVDANSVAVYNNLPMPQWYGYTFGRRSGFPKEYLVPHGIPEEAVVAWIPAMSRSRNIEIHLGELEVPEALVVEAGEASEEAIWRWAVEEVFLRVGVWNAVMTQRLIRAIYMLEHEDVVRLACDGGIKGQWTSGSAWSRVERFICLASYSTGPLITSSTLRSRLVPAV